MSLTVIPAPDMSGANQGWQILADSIRERNAIKRKQQADYQDLILKLSDPNMTEDQQNAVLTQDPKQFQSTYGVPLESVGKDVAKFRTSIGGAQSPKGTGSQGAGGGMALSISEPAGSKRVLVEHPQGTPGEQRAQAELAQTGAQTRQAIASTAAEEQRTDYYRQQLGLNEEEARQKDAAFTMGIKQGMRTADGKPPTMGQVQDFKRGTFDLYPTTEFGKRHELVAGILGGDPNDPASALMQMDLVLDHNIKNKDLERIDAEIANFKSLAEDRKARIEALKKGIDPTTGLATKPFDPKELIAVSDAFNKGLNNALGPLGFPTRTVTNKPWLTAMIPTGTGTSVPLAFAWGTQKVADNPKLAAALFGSGNSDPAVIRRELLATEPKRNLLKVDVPGFDKKTGAPTMLSLTPDQAVPVVAQIRRKLATEMPAVFAALRTVSPQVLLEIAAGNPLVEQMARSYAPDVSAAIDAARNAAPVEAAAAAQGADPNTAPFQQAIDSTKGEIDELRRMLKGAAGSPTSTAPRTDASR